MQIVENIKEFVKKYSMEYFYFKEDLLKKGLDRTYVREMQLRFAFCIHKKLINISDIPTGVGVSHILYLVAAHNANKNSRAAIVYRSRSIASHVKQSCELLFTDRLDYPVSVLTPFDIRNSIFDFVIFST